MRLIKVCNDGWLITNTVERYAANIKDQTTIPELPQKKKPLKWGSNPF
jgi:hypothetical protein